MTLPDTKIADIDLDGSYSTEHADGLGLASLLLERDDESSASCLVVEHSLAVSDEERRRSLLVYGDGELEAVILLAECKGGAPEPAAHSTLFSLVGAWSGDSCVRSAGAATQAFTQSSGGKNPFGFGGANKGGKEAKKGASPAILATRRTNVFKAALTYAWDGAATVHREVEGPVASTVQFNLGNYGHWVTEGLSRVVLLVEHLRARNASGEETRRVPILLDGGSDVVRRSMEVLRERLGLEESDVLWYTPPPKGSSWLLRAIPMALLCELGRRAIYLPISPYISLYLRISPLISPYLPASPRCSRAPSWPATSRPTAGRASWSR